ncbi:hypothetical protein [Streptacidiphilus anmyonensis]|uniref:hypothetical protein n=1 Tax=Streptacidiphilus anmyonensis TaxID=405782 RepID=UPI001F22EC4E|nr:hypothetical protein [Streptacidiphilus anmyonensis]
MHQHDFLPPLMGAGTYAVDPEPSGQPWRSWDEIGEAEAAERGVFAPVARLSCGEPGAVVLAPGDTRGTVFIPDRLDGYCLGLADYDGPNLACAACGLPVAVRVDDCSYWQEVRLRPSAVRRVAGPGRGLEPRPVPWDFLRDEYADVPPLDASGYWDGRWEAAVGASLAHLFAASAGALVSLPPGLLTTCFGRACDRLLPAGRAVGRAAGPAGASAAGSRAASATRTVALGGPGVPDAQADILLVPRHPQTGRTWSPPGAGSRVATVPLAAEVWLHLAFARDLSRLPVTGGLPPGVQRDDPLPLHPRSLFRPAWGVFRHTLARLPAVRSPWLRAVYDGLPAYPHLGPF